MKSIKLTNSYFHSSVSFDEIQNINNDNYIFVKYLNNLHQMITTDNIVNIYPIYDYSTKTINGYIKYLLIDNFKLDKQINIISFNDTNEIDVKDNEIIIKFVNNINDIRIVNIISKLTLFYKDVYIVNLIYDNPIDDIYYVVCKNKINNNDNKLNINNYDYITDINENKQLIYVFLYTCYYYWVNILNAFINNNHEVLTNHFKTMKLIKYVGETT